MKTKSTTQLSPGVNGYLTKKAVLEFLGGTHPIGSTTLRRWIYERGFPKPIYPTPKMPLWDKDKVIAWVQSCCQEADVQR